MTLSAEFTPLVALLGGAMIGLAAAALLLIHGRIAGVSGILARLLPPYEDRAFGGRLAFVAGLVAAPLAATLVTGAAPLQRIAAGPELLIVGGLLVGFGSVWGSGCTSGHGVCGLARLSKRSLAATAIFMATALATVFLMRHAF